MTEPIEQAKEKLMKVLDRILFGRTDDAAARQWGQAESAIDALIEAVRVSALPNRGLIVLEDRHNTALPQPETTDEKSQ